MKTKKFFEFMDCFEDEEDYVFVRRGYEAKRRKALH